MSDANSTTFAVSAFIPFKRSALALFSAALDVFTAAPITPNNPLIPPFNSQKTFFEYFLFEKNNYSYYEIYIY